MILLGSFWDQFFFALFALVTCVFALGVLFSSNVVRMAFYLVISLGASAGLFFLAGAEFAGAMQLMIYVGGTLVLLIFGVMLTAQARFISMKTRAGEWVLALLLGGSLLALLLATSLNVKSWREPNASQDSLARYESETTAQIGNALAGARPDKLSESNELLKGGMSGYLLPFVIVSVHLLVVLIGAGYMARTKRRGGAAAAT